MMKKKENKRKKKNKKRRRREEEKEEEEEKKRRRKWDRRHIDSKVKNIYKLQFKTIFRMSVELLIVLFELKLV